MYLTNPAVDNEGASLTLGLETEDASCVVLGVGRASHCHQLLIARNMQIAPSRPAPERVFGKPRAMTGFLATLTPEQRARVLAFRGDDTFGDPALKKATR